MTQSPVTRRHLLIFAAASGAAAPLAAHGAIPRRGRESPERAALLALCAQLDCPQRLGKLCRDALPPSDRTASSLASTLIADARITAGGHLPATRLAQALQARSRDDFGADRLAMVDGWILSRTEARLYALAALTRARQKNPG